MKIGNRTIGPDEPIYIIAEIGVNHDGSADRACALVDAAADAGADAIKVQCFQTDLLLSRAAKLASYQEQAGERDPVDMLRRLELTMEELAQVARRAHDRGLHAIATVFSVDLVDAADRMGWDAYKLASPDIIHQPLISLLAATGRPLILSTGASTQQEIRCARSWIDPIISRCAFLHCVSSYPTPPEMAHLGMLVDVRRLVEPASVGYSDHTTLTSTAWNARHFGAELCEKHITYDRDAHGPDHAASLDPEQFADYVRLAHQPIADDGGSSAAADPRLFGEQVKSVLACEQDVRRLSRQSVTSRRFIPSGALIEADDLTIKRPGTGVEPARLDAVVGRRASRDIESDMPITDDDLR